MPVVNLLGTIVTNMNATPPVLNDVSVVHGRVRTQKDTLEKGASDSNTSTYRLSRVHSSWVIEKLWLYNDAITGGTSYDVGLYRTAADGGAVVAVGAYATAVDLSAARVAPLDIAFEARDIANIRNKVWQDAGLTSDPNLWYDITLTGNTAGGGAGTIALNTEYSID